MPGHFQPRLFRRRSKILPLPMDKEAVWRAKHCNSYVECNTYTSARTVTDGCTDVKPEFLDDIVCSSREKLRQ